MTNCVLAVDPERGRIWVGRGAQREADKFGPESQSAHIFCLQEGWDTPVTPLDIELADLVCDGDRLIGCQVDGRPGLSRILWSDLSASQWQTMPLPEPVVADPIGFFFPEEGRQGEPSGVLLSRHPHGVVAVDAGSGLIAVIRPGSPKVDFVLKLPPARLEEQWFVVPTPTGVLVAITRNGMDSALVHYSEDGRFSDEFNMEESSSIRGLAMVDENWALLIMKEFLTLLRLSPEPELVHMVPVSFEAPFRFGTVTARPGRVWIVQDSVEHRGIAEVRCEEGAPPELWMFEAPETQGAPLWTYARSRPLLVWEDEEPRSLERAGLSVSVGAAASWRRRFRNEGTQAMGMDIQVGGRPYKVGSVRITVRLDGQELVPVSTEGGEVRFEHRSGIAPGASGEVEITLHGQQAGTGLLAVTLSPWSPSRYLLDPTRQGETHSRLSSFLDTTVE
ncbi:hypothetical protein LXT21_16520 [Myxococcus sp. K38C18041901]|uniref:hypothetical protein n=1 Tax=Myxococcus guangdongensis TaxID=2906760 RepID=UPI0020A74558|nr:hypothetical protein [Myxococcus guangdongensis]MCP3060385.1 hypothetical protein [Myxococcus guangdongensis]